MNNSRRDAILPLTVYLDLNACQALNTIAALTELTPDVAAAAAFNSHAKLLAAAELPLREQRTKVWLFPGQSTWPVWVGEPPPSPRPVWVRRRGVAWMVVLAALVAGFLLGVLVG